MPLIFAAGDVSPTGRPLEHYAEGDATLPVLAAGSGNATTAEVDASSSDKSSLKAVSWWAGVLAAGCRWMAAAGWLPLDGCRWMAMGGVPAGLWDGLNA